jgi:D-alanyl-D-alanine carboxypeptidase
MYKLLITIFMLTLTVLFFTGCSAEQNHSTEKDKSEPTGERNEPDKETPDKNDSIEAVTQPESIQVLVNKQYKLPEDYVPEDLVDVKVPFIFKEKSEKRKMRKEAAAAVEQLFSGAEIDGIHLAGVSAYRSYSTQKSVFNNYVQSDGVQKAKTYSALPGTSEHQTGLAIDVSGIDGKCPAEDCFSETKEAKWLAKNVSKYGFVLRYPKGKEGITGYKYEPWHIRYVGKEIAKDIYSKGITLEEYYNIEPVSN